MTSSAHDLGTNQQTDSNHVTRKQNKAFGDIWGNLINLIVNPPNVNFFHNNGAGPDYVSSGLSVVKVPGSSPDMSGCLVSVPEGLSCLTVAEVPGSNPDLTEVDVWYWLSIL